MKPLKHIKPLCAGMILLLSLTNLAQAMPLVQPGGETDIGVYWDLQLAQGTIPVRNTGTTPVAITSAVGGCACTLVQDWSRIIQPGDTGFVQFTFATNGMVGAIIKTVHLYTDAATGENHFVAPFVVTVKPWQMHEPDVLEMGGHTVQGHVLRAYRLYRMHGNWDVTGVTFPDSRLKVWFRRKNSRFWKIYFTVRPDARPGKFFEMLSVHTTSEPMPVIGLLVSGEILEP